MKLRHLTTSALALILISACSESTGVTTDDLAGTWTATAMVFTSVETPTLSEDVMAFEGVAFTLVLAADGSFTASMTFPGEDVETDTGTYTVVGNIMTLSDSGEGSPEEVTITRSGDTLILTFADVYDFTQDVEEPATLVITLTR